MWLVRGAFVKVLLFFFFANREFRLKAFMKTAIFFTFSVFHRSCFLKSLSFTPKFVATVALHSRRLFKPNKFLFLPISLIPSSTLSLTQVWLICSLFFYNLEQVLVFITSRSIYLWKVSAVVSIFKYLLTTIIGPKLEFIVRCIQILFRYISVLLCSRNMPKYMLFTTILQHFNLST